MSKLKSVFKYLLSNRKLILSLAFNDFKNKYTGSYFGVVWAFIQPLITIVVFWFVFQVGLKVMPIDTNVPFALWFICGMIPWFFFSDALSSTTNSFLEYSYLVKKVVFRISILPLIKVISSLFVHLVFIVVLLIVFICYGHSIDLYALQLLYYSVCVFALVTALGFITSTVVVFFKDLNQFVGIVLQFGMWITPIMWSYKIVLPQYMWLVKLNPLFYIVEGYRNSLIYHRWFFDHLGDMLNFWGQVATLAIIGVLAYKRLRTHFADVL